MGLGPGSIQHPNCANGFMKKVAVEEGFEESVKARITEVFREGVPGIISSKQEKITNCISYCFSNYYINMSTSPVLTSTIGIAQSSPCPCAMLFRKR